MSAHRIVKNVFSSWASLVLAVVLTFFVSPIIVHSLGKEAYGIWVIIMSITGYFTMLDLGINTAIVKYISEYFSQKDEAGIRTIFSSSMFVFMIVAVMIIVIGTLIGYNFERFFEFKTLPAKIVIMAFGIIVLDMAIGMIFSVFTGTLAALQEFVALNAISISATILKNAVLVTLLLNGYGLVGIACVQLATSLIRCCAQFFYLRFRHPQIYFEAKQIKRDTFKIIYQYSIYSFIIVIALKILFYTDSIVIGKMIGTEQVAYFAIPSSLLDYIEKFIHAMIAVQVPIISANSALGLGTSNQKFYLLGTRYAMLLSIPVLVSLFFVGPDFISLWMGADFGSESRWVLRILIIGYGIMFSQLIAYGLLKGIAKHRILALILFIEACANLAMSIVLAPIYGIEGVALGTAVPLWIASLGIAGYTCKCLDLNILTYLKEAYFRVVLVMLVTIGAAYFLVQPSDSYWMVFGQSFLIFIFFASLSVPTCLAPEHYRMLHGKIFRTKSIVNRS